MSVSLITDHPTVPYLTADIQLYNAGFLIEKCDSGKRSKNYAWNMFFFTTLGMNDSSCCTLMATARSFFACLMIAYLLLHALCLHTYCLHTLMALNINAEHVR